MNQRIVFVALLLSTLNLQAGAQTHVGKSTSTAASAVATTPLAQPAFVITADDSASAVKRKEVDLPSAPDEVLESKKDTGPIHIWATRINYDSYLWGFIFLMPFAAGFFLLSNICAYFKKREHWNESIRKENIELPRTSMGE